MPILILESDNSKALEAIKVFAKVFNIESTMNSQNEENTLEIKGVKVIKAKRKFNFQELVGSLTDLNLQDPSIIRKKEWTRKKAIF